MNIHYNNNPHFGQQLPTKALFKSALGIHEFEDAKLLNLSMGTKYAGKVSFHIRAQNIAQNVTDKNKNIEELVLKMKNYSKPQQLQEINKLTSTLGETIDVIV